MTIATANTRATTTDHHRHPVGPGVRSALELEREELAQAKQQFEELIALASHELQGPIRRLLSFVELLELDARPGPPTGREYRHRPHRPIRDAHSDPHRGYGRFRALDQPLADCATHGRRYVR